MAASLAFGAGKLAGAGMGAMAAHPVAYPLIAWTLISEILGQVSGGREAKTERAHIKLMKDMEVAQQEGMKKATEQSQANTNKYMEQIMRMNEIDREREYGREASMFALQAKQDQSQMMMQLLSNLGQMGPASTIPVPQSGIMSMMTQ